MADLSTLDDRVLWNRVVNARCEDAFRTLMVRHEKLVWNVCSRLLRNNSDTEDAFQMAFIAMLEHGEDIKSADFRPWLYRVAYRAALRVQSARVDVDTLTELNAVPEDAVDTEVFRSIERAEQSQLIDEALDTLPEKYREVLVLHYCCGVARDDIASQLGLTPQTVKARLSRAREALRSRLLRRGLSLSLAAVFLSSAAAASIPPQLHDSTWQLAQQWLTGKPVGLDLAQFSDFPQTEYGMKSLSGLNAKWTLAGAAALLAMFLVFEAGRASGSSISPGVLDGTNPLPATGTRIGFEQKDRQEDIVPAAHFVAKPAVSEPIAQKQPEPQPQPTQQAAAPQHQVQHIAQAAYQQAAANSQMTAQALTQSKTRGLPNGTWKRDSMLGSVTFLVDGNRLQVDFQGKGEMAIFHGSLLGEYSVASDGTVFGLIHGVDVDLPAELLAEGAGELGPLMGMLSDSPFAMRVHTSGNTMVVKEFTLGVALPMIDGIEKYAGIGTMVNMYVAGAYRSDRQPQRVGQLPPRMRTAPLPRHMQPLQYRQAYPVPATISVQPNYLGPVVPQYPPASSASPYVPQTPATLPGPAAQPAPAAQTAPKPAA